MRDFLDGHASVVKVRTRACRVAARPSLILSRRRGTITLADIITGRHPCNDSVPRRKKCLDKYVPWATILRVRFSFTPIP